MQRRTALATLGASMLGAMAPAWAQGFPNAAVKLIVPYSAGGGADAVARLLALGMGEELKQGVIVDNRAGAGGMVGAEAVAKAAPDGYTVLFAGNPELTIVPWLHPKLSYAPLTDFTPLVLVSQSPNVLVANASLSAKTLRAALETARKAPGGITIGTPGNGTPQHIAVELLKQQSGMDIVHVPYKGASPATVAALGGEVSFALVGAPPLLPHLASGKLVPLAVTQPKRSPLLPEVPTLGEAIGLMRDDDFVAWYGVLVPSRTPPETAKQLEKAAFAVLKRSDTQAKLASLGTDLVALPTDKFSERMRNESKRYSEIIHRFGIKAA
ncbi:Bug family tripartite tricarboxylate transporter substrate binding protein [Variovorax ginsengisoli]|uniref:Tripartite-type tricarboxylate transporter receptor subunit TctC n=1 Tax=Variovorax ginsengisoli TaxID=363844 RepID=A0ABT9S225_9BURK|nr:tripartite tricarboxylate transporter substrate-binding protein [Variovorax ginsengisoli]MDP9897933.1 tripartite-type tricarboxylate transporter receptor subunit TctC [Variovorax ginsengisoli]